MSELNEKFGITAKNGITKFIAKEDMYPVSKGQIVTLSFDDTTSMPEFIVDGKKKHISISLLELLEEEKTENTGSIENDITSCIDIIVNVQAKIKLCDNETGRYIQYSDQIIGIDSHTYEKVKTGLVDNRNFNTDPYSYKEDYFLSGLGFEVPKYKKPLF